MTIPAKFDSHFEVTEKTISERLAQLMKCKPDDFFEVVTNDSGRIIGYHCISQFKAPHGEMAANIQTLWVDADYRKKGIATTLKARGEAWAKEHKLDHISTFVSSKNSSMLELNQSLGFELIGYKLRKKL